MCVFVLFFICFWLRGFFYLCQINDLLSDVCWYLQTIFLLTWKSLVSSFTTQRNRACYWRSEEYEMSLVGRTSAEWWMSRKSLAVVHQLCVWMNELPFENMVRGKGKEILFIDTATITSAVRFSTYTTQEDMSGEDFWVYYGKIWTEVAEVWVLFIDTNLY